MTAYVVIWGIVNSVPRSTTTTSCAARSPSSSFLKLHLLVLAQDTDANIFGRAAGIVQDVEMGAILFAGEIDDHGVRIEEANKPLVVRRVLPRRAAKSLGSSRASRGYCSDPMRMLRSSLGRARSRRGTGDCDGLAGLTPPPSRDCHRQRSRCSRAWACAERPPGAKNRAWN